MKTAAQWIYRFGDECKESAGEFYEFCRSEKSLRWLLAVFILILWGVKITGDDIFLDSEIMSLEPYGLLQSWYGSKRFGLILTKRLFHMIRLVPFLSNLLFMIALWGAMLLLAFCLTRWMPAWGSKERRPALYIIAALFVSCPSLAEQYAFTLQAFEITWAMCLCITAVFCAGEAIYEKKSPIWYLFAVGLLVWSLASYQAFSSVYITLVLISFLGRYEKREGETGQEEHAFRYGLQHAALFLVSFISYLLLSEFLCRWKGGDSSYVEAMFLWGNADVGVCLNNIADEFRILYYGLIPTIYYRYFGILVLIASALMAVRAVRLRFHKKIWYMLALILLSVSPLFITMLTGMRTPVRGQLVYPLTFGFFAASLWFQICEWVKRSKALVSCGAFFCGVVTALFFYQSWIQGMNLVQLNQTLHETIQHDRLTAERVYMDVCKVADREDMQNVRVVFVGTRDARMPQTAARGEVIGHSFFDFGITNIGVTNRVAGLFNLMGMNNGGAAPEDYTAALEAAKGKPNWPASEAVFWLDDFIVVKLSD